MLAYIAHTPQKAVGLRNEGTYTYNGPEHHKDSGTNTRVVAPRGFTTSPPCQAIPMSSRVGPLPYRRDGRIPAVPLGENVYCGPAHHIRRLRPFLASTTG